MISNQNLLRLSFFIMICLSSILLGLGQVNLSLPIVAISMGLAGIIFVDWLKWFSLPRWVANILSIGVLILTMKGFLEERSGSQLIAVANLLVYLQSLLMLQEKTPRQYWQLVVLNLLQIVVAAVFVLNLEGSVLFLIYMCIAAFFLSHLTCYDEAFKLGYVNRSGRGQQSLFLRSGPATNRLKGVRVLYDPKPLSKEFFRTATSHLIVWITVSLAFSMVLFVLIPRHQTAWFAGAMASTSKTGATKQVNLNERGLIKPTYEPVMRVTFRNPNTLDIINPAEMPYLRGMALSSLVIKDDKTTWEAPYDRVYSYDYHELPFAPGNIPSNRKAIVEVKLEPTTDPLLHVVTPAFGVSGVTIPGEFSRSLSAVTRRRNSDKIEMTPFQYEFLTVLDRNRAPLRGWQYTPETNIPSARTMAGNQAEYKWLTEIDPTRYPTLVRIAGEIADEVNSESHFEIASAMERHFWNASVYSYTLDYTDVARDEFLDPVEDFVRNHHTGHCEIYASAMVLMLRSQGIPARLVVGFLGGEYYDDFYGVTTGNAHAWVEVYIRPEDCTQRMFANGEAGPGGCWYRMDPTPANERATAAPSGISLNRARQLWQDYVLGLSNENQADMLSTQSQSLAGLMDISQWSGRVQEAVDKVQQNRLLQTITIVGAIMIIAVATFFTFRSDRKSRRPTNYKRISFVRRIAAQALSFLSPQLGDWMLGEARRVTRIPFYERFLALMRKYGVERQSTETASDFLTRASNHFSESERSNEIRSAITDLTKSFQLARFRGDIIEAREAERLNQLLVSLEQMV
ncbi:MAG: DUF3488 and transglutaminase-like domain-containing protein [Pirellulaceae bacterium]